MKIKKSEKVCVENGGEQPKTETEPVAFGLKAIITKFSLDESKDLEVIEESLQHSPSSKYKWLEVDKKAKSGKFLNYPSLEEIPENINVQLIVELYSK